MYEVCMNCGQKIGCFDGLCLKCIESIKQTIVQVQDEAKKEIWDDYIQSEVKT